MLEFNRDPQQTIPTTQLKIVGLGGAGANMIDRLALDGSDGAEVLALNTDVRTLAASAAREKVQLGRNLTRGLGAGGDPELGQQAALEAEAEIRGAIGGRRIVFLCVGLGGGTGSGGAPVVARIAREEGAFVVVFASIPFAFEGRRRREQAEKALNELSVLANALVTFDNARMAELVLAKQGIHEAFAAADRMITESIRAVTRLVTRPGLIHVGLDDLMSALRVTRSRCLFGSGVASGKDRAAKSLRAALASPLLDQGLLLREADTVLVHLCGGEDLTLYEVELLMQRLARHVPPAAHVLFGAAVDPAMGDSLSVTLMSALPEERLREAAATADESAPRESAMEPSEGFGLPSGEEVPTVEEFPPLEVEPERETVPPELAVMEADGAESGGGEVADLPFAEAVVEPPAEAEPAWAAGEVPRLEPNPDDWVSPRKPGAGSAEGSASEEPFHRRGFGSPVARFREARATGVAADESGGADPFADDDSPFQMVGRGSGQGLGLEDVFVAEDGDLDAPAGKARGKRGTEQAELAFEGGPRGKFSGEVPNLFEGENLDVPAYLRRKKG